MWPDDSTPRVAAYYAPTLDDPLWALGASWLGRDAETGALEEQPDIPGIAEVTADPWLYGFHATLKPPMRLRPGATWDAVVTLADDIAARTAPFDLPPLRIDDLFGFLAVVDAEPSAALQSFCDAFVEGLDPLRAAPNEAERAKRERSATTPRQRQLLARWDYPYVFEEWFFHMTLTRRLTEAEHKIFRPAAETMFAPALATPRRVTEVCLFVQTRPGAPFLLADRLQLRG